MRLSCGILMVLSLLLCEGGWGSQMKLIMKLYVNVLSFFFQSAIDSVLLKMKWI